MQFNQAAPHVDVDEFAPRLSFFFNAQIDFFEEIAKYRAARRIWARWLRDRYGATDPRSMTLRFHTQTAGASLTAQQPELNIVRTAIEGARSKGAARIALWVNGANTHARALYKRLGFAPLEEVYMRKI